ncbi:hypothetical protein ACIQXF_11235 [Lysinibacillus sp. NPDC097231]|uniref:hypothetical protein n=1 Tax=Lysinibacillus sp. NPDC097231 TaxID=3364142 RepID=UPI00380691D4
MKKGRVYLTLLFGIVFGLGTLLLFIHNDLQREKLVALQHSQQQTVIKAWYLADSHSKEQRLYPLKQLFYVERFEIEDTASLQQVLMTGQYVKVSRPTNQESFKDLYIVFDNGQELALKLIENEMGMYLMDQKTMKYYELQDDKAIEFLRQIDEKSQSSLLIIIIYSILYWSAIAIIVIKIMKCRTRKEEAALIEEPTDENKKKQERVSTIFVAALSLSITIIPSVYGAKHMLLIISIVLLVVGIREWYEKRQQFWMMILLCMILCVYLYSNQFISTYFN